VTLEQEERLIVALEKAAEALAAIAAMQKMPYLNPLSWQQMSLHADLQPVTPYRPQTT